MHMSPASSQVERHESRAVGYSMREVALLALKMHAEAIGCVMGQGSDVHLL